MMVLTDGAISAVGFQSRGTTFNSLTHVRHQPIIHIDVKMPKAELGFYSNFAATLIGSNAASKPRDIFGIKHGMIGREQCVGKTS